MAGLSYGLLETRGLICAIESADAMVKAAQVRLIKQHNPGRALVTIICEGDLAACQAAVEAGSTAAMRFGELISAHVIPRPDIDTDHLVEELISKKNKPGDQGNGPGKDESAPDRSGGVEEKPGGAGSLAGAKAKKSGARRSDGAKENSGGAGSLAGTKEKPGEAAQAPAAPAKAGQPESSTADLHSRTLRHIQAHPEGITADDLAAALKLERPALLGILKALLDEGRIEKMQRMYYPYTDQK